MTNAGSKLQTNNFLRVGFGNTGAADPAVGRLNVSDNATVIVNGWFGVGQDGGDGTLNMTGGTMQVDNEFYVGIDTNGHARNSTGAANVTGGSITARNLIVGRSGGKGVVNISGGTVTATNSVEVGVNGSSTFQVSNYATADAVIDGGPELAFSFTANYSTSNTQDNGDAGGPFGLGVQVQGLPAGDNDDFAFVGLGNFTVGTTGSYVFGNNTDDGSRLRLSINGGVFTEIITDNILSGPHTVSSAAIALNATDTIALQWMWFERGGGAEGETWYSRDGGANALWEDASQGLTLAGGIYSGTVFKSTTTVSVGDGTLNLTGGILTTQFVRAGGGLASLTLNGGTIQALGNEGDFIRGFNNAGGHSAIILVGAGGTIDSNGKNIGITAGNEITGTTLTKVGAGALTIDALQTYSTLEVNGGRVNLNTVLDNATINANTGILVVNASLTNTDVNVDNTNSTYFTVNQTLSSLNIADGGYVEITSTPPPAPAPAFAGGAGGGGGFESSVADASNPLLVTSAVQGVPEPGTVSLLLLSALGLLGRRQRHKRD